MNLIKPQFWDKKSLSILSLVLFPLTLITRIFIFLKKKNKYKSKIRTVCIGNIYIGGTGKTPLSIKLNHMTSKKYKSVLIKKYYENQEDEINLLKKNGKLIVRKNRVDAIKIAEKSFQIAFFDDGLQDPNIKYDFSIVCFNSKIGFGNKFMIPAGPLRESLKSLINYDAVFINGNKNKNLIAQIKKINKKIKIIEGKYFLKNKNELKKFKDNLIFSGIGNPQEFEELLFKNKVRVRKSIRFADHYQYSQQEILNLKEEARINKLKIITTEKDYIRIPKMLRKNINFAKIELKIFNEKILKELIFGQL